MLILISDAFDEELPKKLSKYGEVTDDKNRLAEAEIVIVRSKTKVDKAYIDIAKKMKLVIRGGVGLDNIDRIYAQEKGIMVRNTADASTTAVAELAFAMMIAMTCHITKGDASMREGKWLKKELKRTELHGKTLGILGLGRIGLALAVRAQAFSKGMINKETLKQFKDGAYLVNTARGGICVEEDIVEALKSGKLAGFATDVWYSDPPENSPLFDAPNTLFLPHIGASTKENMSRIGIIVERLIADYVENK